MAAAVAVVAVMCAGVYRMCADKCRMEKASILFERFSDDDNGDHDLRTVRLGLPISLEHLILFVHLYIFDLLIATRIEFFE